MKAFSPASPALLKSFGFTRLKGFGESICWKRGIATITEPKPTLNRMIQAIHQDAHAAGYAKAQADMQAAAKAFLGPLGLLPDARVQQMRELPTQP